MDAIKYEKDNDGIVTLTMDMPGSSANTMNGVYRTSMAAAVKKLEEEKRSEGKKISGIILNSKDTQRVRGIEGLLVT